jgi:hypothetical protein
LKLELNSFKDGDSKHQSKILEITAQKLDCYFWRKTSEYREFEERKKKDYLRKLREGDEINSLLEHELTNLVLSGLKGVE